MYAGMSEHDIVENLNQKQKILTWMVKKEIRDLDRIGLIMSRYYRGQFKI